MAIDHMQAMEQEMKTAQDQISARREEQERSIQSVRRLVGSMIVAPF